MEQMEQQLESKRKKYIAEQKRLWNDKANWIDARWDEMHGVKDVYNSGNVLKDIYFEKQIAMGGGLDNCFCCGKLFKDDPFKEEWVISGVGQKRLSCYVHRADINNGYPRSIHRCIKCFDDDNEFYMWMKNEMPHWNPIKDINEWVKI